MEAVLPWGRGMPLTPREARGMRKRLQRTAGFGVGMLAVPLDAFAVSRAASARGASPTSGASAGVASVLAPLETISLGLISLGCFALAGSIAYVWHRHRQTREVPRLVLSVPAFAFACGVVNLMNAVGFWSDGDSA